jgi:hypothetical protein
MTNKCHDEHAHRLQFLESIVLETTSCRNVGKDYVHKTVIGPFRGPCASGSYEHQTALFLSYENKIDNSTKAHFKII